MRSATRLLSHPPRAPALPESAIRAALGSHKSAPVRGNLPGESSDNIQQFQGPGESRGRSGALGGAEGVGAWIKTSSYSSAGSRQKAALGKPGIPSLREALAKQSEDVSSHKGNYSRSSSTHRTRRRHRPLSSRSNEADQDVVEFRTDLDPETALLGKAGRAGREKNRQLTLSEVESANVWQRWEQACADAGLQDIGVTVSRGINRLMSFGSSHSLRSRGTGGVDFEPLLNMLRSGEAPLSEMNHFARGRIASKLVENGRVDVAIQVLEIISAGDHGGGGGGDAYLWNNALAACKKHGVDVAHKLWRAFHKSQVRPDIFSYNSYLSCFQQPALGAEALAIFDEMKSEGVMPDVVSYTCVIGSCRKEHTKAAIQLFHELREQFDCSTTQYNALFTALRRGRVSVHLALGYFKEMVESGVARNMMTYITLVNMCSQAHMFSSVVDLCEHMNADGFHANGAIATRLICAFAHTDDVASAVSLLDARADMAKGARPLSAAYAAAILACGRAQDTETCLRLLDVSERQYSQLHASSLESRNDVFRAAIRALRNCGEPHQILRVLERMHEAKIPMSVATVRAAVSSLEMVGLACETWVIFERLLQTEWGLAILSQHATIRTQAFYAICNSADANGDNNVLRLFAPLLVLAANQKQTTGANDPVTCAFAVESATVVPVSLLTDALKKCFSVGNYAVGTDLLEQFKPDGFFPSDIASAVVLACARQNMWNEATAVLQSIVSHRSHISGEGLNIPSHPFDTLLAEARSSNETAVSAHVSDLMARNGIVSGT